MSRTFPAFFLALAALLACGPARAAVTSENPSGFLLTHRVEIKANARTVFEVLGQPRRWWSKEHTYSGDAGHLRLDLNAGGCFCEVWNNNSVVHARVIMVMRERLVRLSGALGPLQELGVNGILTFALEPRDDRTIVTMTYRVRGSPDAALDALAPKVDAVLVEQVQRLAAYIETPPAAPKAAALQDQFFDSNGVRIRYVELGKGEPVILVHDFADSVETSWVQTGVMAAIAQNFRVVAFDARGHGKSGKPHDPAQYGREMGLDIVRLMDHLGIAKAHIVGYSMGADIIAQLATTHADRFQTMTLGGAAGIRHWTADDERAAQAEAAEMEQGLLRTHLLGLWPKDQPPPNEEEIRRLSQERLAAQDLAALAAVRRSMKELVVTDAQMAAMPVPTLGVVGSLDPHVSDFVDLRRIMPRLVRMIAIEGATHATALRTPDFLGAVVYFLRYNPIPAR